MEVVAQQSFSGSSYEQILALPGSSGKVAMLRNGSLQLELFQFFNPRPEAKSIHRPLYEHGISHFCVEVSDIAQEYERLRAIGVSFHCVPLDFSGIAKATYGRDPDGNVFELWGKGSVE